MGLDESTRRFAFLLQRDLRRFAEKRAEREARGEEVTYDSVSRLATMETRRGDVVARLYGEPLASYSPRDRILRWAWVGRAPSTSTTYADVILREAHARGVPQLAASVVGDLDPDDARTLVTLGALLARAEAIHERKTTMDVQFVGLFDRPRPTDAPSHHSVPPPPVAAPSVDKAERGEKSEARSPSQPPPRAYRSLPPIREIYEPRGKHGSSPPQATGADGAGAGAAGAGARGAAGTGGGASAGTGSSPPPSLRPIREPSRTIFFPVASAALAALAAASKGFVQGLFVVTIDRESASAGSAPKRRATVQLVCVDAAGLLRALDPPAALVDAVVAMIEADHKDGNGPWRKLSARITPKSDGGATLNVEVV